MARDALKSGRKFEPASVMAKFDIDARTTSILPLIFDVVEMKMIRADIVSGTARRGTVTESADKLKAQTRAILDLPSTRPTAMDVLRTHVEARGTLVSSPDAAETTFAAANLDLGALIAMTAARSPDADVDGAMRRTTDSDRIDAAGSAADRDE